ncbi:SKG6 domain protein [Ceratobasidium sp. AG-Ba]|nr:SKG6 domain protein [Ceratobasidium sp. AG-Ba]
MIAVPTILLLLLPLRVLAQTNTDFGPQLTAAALEIQGAISPACEKFDDCETFVNTVVPRCQTLRGDPGCWCGNHDPLHYCAICMSNPTNNQTTADQTAAAIDGHSKYHQLCNAYSASLNATASAGASSTASGTSGQSSPSVSSESGGGSKTPIGAIVGGAVGGVAVLLITALVLFCWLRSRKEENRIKPSSVSLFSAPASSLAGRPYSGYDHSQPQSPPPQMKYNAGYAPPAVPYNGTGVYSPPPTSNTSYSKYPEPMAAV